MKQELTQAAILTFEELGFVFAQPENDRAIINETLAVSVLVNFQGEFAGKLVLSVEKKMLPTLAANMLGEDETTISEEFQRDALGEIANVICGNALPEIAGKRAVFHLEAPQFLLRLPALQPSAFICLLFDEGRADVLLFRH